MDVSWRVNIKASIHITNQEFKTRRELQRGSVFERRNENLRYITRKAGEARKDRHLRWKTGQGRIPKSRIGKWRHLPLQTHDNQSTTLTTDYQNPLAPPPLPTLPYRKKGKIKGVIYSFISHPNWWVNLLTAHNVLPRSRDKMLPTVSSNLNLW